jgi:hypothetical protein
LNYSFFFFIVFGILFGVWVGRAFGEAFYFFTEISRGLSGCFKIK